MRKEESGWPAKVKVGYGTAFRSRGLHPRGLAERLVHREMDLEPLDPALHIVRISRRVGERKRLTIVAKATERNFHIANPGKEKTRPVAETSKEPEPAIDVADSPAVEAKEAPESVQTEDEAPAVEGDSE